MLPGLKQERIKMVKWFYMKTRMNHSWDKELITKGAYYLKQSAQGNKLSKYHLEASIAYWHTIKEDTKEKWENILQLYNQLLQLQYSPVAALNRTYALSKARRKKEGDHRS